MYRHVAFAAIVACASACGDDLSSRDFTDNRCQPPLTDTSWPRMVCDRGAGQTPRYVTVEACMEELRLRQGELAVGLNSTSPNYLRCRPGVLIITIDDVRNGTGLVSY